MNWNLIGVSAVLLPRCLSNFRAIGKIKTGISCPRDFTRSYCNDPAGNAGKPVLRMVTQMLVWGQCVHRSWHAIQCVWNISEFSPYVEVPTSDPGGQVWCQMSNRPYVCPTRDPEGHVFIYLHSVSRFRYSCRYVKVIKRPQPAAADDQEAWLRETNTLFKF